MIGFNGAGYVLLADEIRAEKHKRIWRSGDVALRAALSWWAAFARRRGRCGNRWKERIRWRFWIRFETVVVWFDERNWSDVGSKSNAFGRRLADTVITMLEGIHRDWMHTLATKDWIDLIRTTYGEQVKNVYDVLMYEEQACLSLKVNIPNRAKQKGWESEGEEGGAGRGYRKQTRYCSPSL